jgi:hypothetical protein
LVTGVRVRVSDASPRGFSGRVTAVHPGALTVARDDNGARQLVLLSRRRVVAVETQPSARTPWQATGNDPAEVPKPEDPKA